ncbi:MAG: elongation factor G, partial [Candidatus Latescibacteria bacterium]|nr:elongation factor G [Candidatus Latescibacterota bacterium]
MKTYGTKDIRNISLIGHSASGKSSLAEAMIYTSGVTNRMGKVEDGNMKSDYLEDEISRQISIGTSLLQIEWEEKKLNIVDTPGYADFVGEVISGLRAVDAAVLLVDAVSGLEVGTETSAELCKKYDKPVFIIINRIGKEHADLDKVVNSLKNRFGIKALPIQIPVNPGIGFNKIVDIVSMKEYTYDIDGKGKGKTGDITGDLGSKAEEMHEKLIEAAAESDDTLMEKYFESGLTPEEIGTGLKKAIQNRTLFPVLFTDALTNVGVDLLMKLLAGSAPSPADIPDIVGKKGKTEIELKASDDAPLSMLVFKTIVEQHMGELSLFRIFSGSYKTGDEIYNSNRSSSEKATVIFNLIGKDRVEVPSLSAGDMGTFVKMKNTKTGDTLCSKQMPIELPPLEFLEPVMDVAVRPLQKGEEDKVSQGLLKLHDEDPSFISRTDSELKQIILEGLGGLHIDVIIDRFKRKFGIDVELKPPKIPYRETITGKSDEKYRYKKQTGGHGQYGEVYFRMEPLPRGKG